MFKKYLVQALGSIFLSASFTVAADTTEPFDFAYSIDGKNKRPVAVFNDGKDTFIQVVGMPKISFNNLNLADISQRGPYFVVKGVPTLIEGISDGEIFSIKWQGATNSSLSNEVMRNKSDFPEKSLYGTFGRIAFVNGVPADAGIVNEVPANLQLKEVLKALAPHGWTGSADRSINVTQTIQVESKVGESWVIVLDRIMKNIGTWVEIDSQKQNLYLRDAPPKGFSVVLDNKLQHRSVQAVTVGDLPRSNDFKPFDVEVPLSNTTLSSANLAKISRKDGHLVLTLIDPRKPMRFTNGDGKVLEAILSEDGAAYKIPDQDSIYLEVMNGEKIEIRLMRKQSAKFDQVNALQLLEVNQENGITSFKFPQQTAFQLVDDKNRIATGNWIASTFSTPVQSTEWKLKNNHVAVHIQMEDKSFYAWRPLN